MQGLITGNLYFANHKQTEPLFFCFHSCFLTRKYYLVELTMKTAHFMQCCKSTEQLAVAF